MSSVRTRPQDDCSAGSLTETRVGIILAQTFVAAPFLVIAARAAFRAVDPALEDVAASLGHGRLARFTRVAVPAALPGIGAGLMLAWLRAFGEFGATVILAYHPYSLPVFTFVQFDGAGLPATMLPIALALGSRAGGAAVRGASHPASARTSPDVPARSRRPRPHAPAGPGLRRGQAAWHVLARCLPRREQSAPGAARTLWRGKDAHAASARRVDADEGDAHVRVGTRALDPVPTEGRGIGYVPQQPALFPRRNVWQQVTFGARLAEMKVPTNDDSGNAKPGHKNPGDEFVRAHRRQRGVKSDNDDAVESEPGADFGFVPGRRQPERDRPGGEEVRRMRLEGQHRAWRRALAGKGNRTLDDRLMAKMQAIEISDRVNRAFKPIGRRQRVRGEDEIVAHFVFPMSATRRPIPSIRRTWL